MNLFRIISSYRDFLSLTYIGHSNLIITIGWDPSIFKLFNKLLVEEFISYSVDEALSFLFSSSLFLLAFNTKAPTPKSTPITTASAPNNEDMVKSPM